MSMRSLSRSVAASKMELRGVSKKNQHGRKNNRYGTKAPTKNHVPKSNEHISFFAKNWREYIHMDCRSEYARARRKRETEDLRKIQRKIQTAAGVEG